MRSDRLALLPLAAAPCAAGLLTVDSFLLDPFLLFANGFFWGFIWGRIWKPRAWPKSLPVAICALTVAFYWSVSLSLYANLDWVDWLAKWCGAQNGRDWMLNSGVFHFDFLTPGTTTHVVSGLIFLTYPIWISLGAAAGARTGHKEPKPA
jgi:hypothetical protein